MSEQSSSVENPFAGQGSVLLDIGGDIGALVVTMPRVMVGTEVEIRPVGVGGSHAHGHDHDHDHDHPHAHPHDQPHAQEDHRPGDHGHGPGDHLVHVAVVNRPVGDGRVPSLVFPELVAGRYELFEKGDGERVMLRAEISGGEVTALAWPT